MTDIPIREYIERILDEREKAHDAAHRSEHVALELQARETERRLELLNRSFERAAEDRAGFVRKDRYDDDVKVRSAEVAALADKLNNALEIRSATVDQHFDRLEKDLEPVEVFRSRAVFLAPILVILGGIVGAVIEKVVLGH